MIKLIATDMDGTLLNDKKQLPAEFPEVLKELWKRDITFAIASGRSKPALIELFGELSEDLIFICDNGACVQMPHKEPVLKCLPVSAVNKVLDLCRTLDGVVPVLCGVKNIYYPLSAKEQFQKEITNFYVNFLSVPYRELYNISDNIIKIAICDLHNPTNNSYPVFSSLFGDEYELVISGAMWMDIMCKDVSKGNAVHTLQKELNITSEETMVFGDYGNDVSMFPYAYYSYAMNNASNEIKNQANFIAPSNNENGVMKIICKILNLNCF